MKLTRLLLVFSSVFCAGYAQQNCQSHAVDTCNSNSATWTDGNTCNAVYGNISGNKQNLKYVLKEHLRQSFQFIVMGSYFSTDVINRMGMNKILMNHSDKMWARAQKIMHFLLHRGSKTSDLASTMKLNNIN